MNIAQRRTRRYSAIPVLAIAVSIAIPQFAFADPPPWAPAHGWRKKNDPNYQGYTGKKWDQDYGVVEGRCNREAAGAAVGGVVGGAVGSQIGGGNGRTIAIVLGSVLGAMVGAKIGRDMDNADRACIGHALELAGDGRSVAWTSGELAYVLTPVNGFARNGQQCRNYKLELTSRGGKKDKINGAACHAGADTWQVIS